MTEWGVVTVIAALVGLFFAVGNPVLKLNNTITVLDERLKNIVSQQASYETRNSDTHTRIFKELEDHDETLAAHTLRLHDLDGK